MLWSYLVIALQHSSGKNGTCYFIYNESVISLSQTSQWYTMRTFISVGGKPVLVHVREREQTWRIYTYSEPSSFTDMIRFWWGLDYWSSIAFLGNHYRRKIFKALAKQLCFYFEGKQTRSQFTPSFRRVTLTALSLTGWAYRQNTYRQNCVRVNDFYCTYCTLSSGEPSLCQLASTSVVCVYYH